MKTKTAVVGALLVAAAGWLGACVAQPNPGCPVATPYWVKYAKVIDATGDCGKVSGDRFGFAKFSGPEVPEDTVAFRPRGLGIQVLPEDLGGGGRVDPTDPNHAKANGTGKITSFPAKDNFCDVTDIVAAEQRFEPTPDTMEMAEDGGMEVVPGEPELYRKYEWSSLRILATPNAPGTVLTGNLKFTEDTCTANFEAVGLWPPVPCNPDENIDWKDEKGYNLECDPRPSTPDAIKEITALVYPDLQADGTFPDGGSPDPFTHPTGSGVNPTFAPKGKPITCGKGGYCEFQVSVEDLSKL
jgi:hypothetical protein